MSFSKGCVDKSIGLLLEKPSGNLLEDLTNVALNDFIGQYDHIIRVPKSEVDGRTQAFVVALRVARACLKQLKATGAITYGSVIAKPVHNYEPK